MRLAAVPLLLALLLALPAARAQAQDTTIAEPSTSQLVSAHGGRMAWSEGDRLMTWIGGVSSQVPVAPQPGGFDVNLGRGPDGGTVAVYSRDDGLYLYDFAAASEQRIHRLSKSGVREQGPVIDGDRVAFFRGNARGRGMVVGSLRNGYVRAIPKLPREIGPYDFRGRRLAYTVGRFRGDRFTDTLYVQDVVSGRRRALARVSSGLLSSARFAGTTFGGRFLYVARVRRMAAGNRFNRIHVRTGRTREVRGRGGILEASFDRGRALYLAARGEAEECAPCTLALTTPLDF